MAENIPLSTIGVKVSYAVETTAGTRPTTGYTHIKGLMSTPDFNTAPNTADATSFDNLEYTTKIRLLKDLPDSLEFGCRFGQQFYNDWVAVKTAFDALTGGKNMWFCIEIPSFDKAIFFKGEPVSIGIPAMEANSGIDGSVYVIPIGEPTFETKPV